MSVYGAISGHLWRAREALRAVDTTSTWQRLTVDALVVEIDVVLIAVRRLHHAMHVGDDRRQ